MEITKETHSIETLLTSYEKMPLDLRDTETEEIVPTSEELPSYYSIALPAEEATSEVYVDLVLTTEEAPSQTLLDVLKEGVTIFLNVKKVETEETLPLIQVHKETIEDGK